MQAFNALIEMWQKYPRLFDPVEAAWWRPEEVQKVLKTHIGWDSKSASISWVENSRRLMRNWGGNPLNLIKGLRNYDEALRRIKNKTTKKELREAEKFEKNGEGFRGSQPKMVSMLLYFYDWEEWLRPRFNYPSPADFHNFRIGLAFGAIFVELEKGERLSASEKLSAPWRYAIMEYLKARKADPVEVSDAIWLFSLVMCGNSPLTKTKETKARVADLFSHTGTQELVSQDARERWLASQYRIPLSQTCFPCPFLALCKFAIPANPYYRKGQLELRERLLLERYMDLTLLVEPSPREVVVDQHVLQLVHYEEPASA
jgi:hypothetical protein